MLYILPNGFATCISHLFITRDYSLHGVSLHQLGCDTINKVIISICSFCTTAARSMASLFIFPWKVEHLPSIKVAFQKPFLPLPRKKFKRGRIGLWSPFYADLFSHKQWNWPAFYIDNPPRQAGTKPKEPQIAKRRKEWHYLFLSQVTFVK